MRATWYDGGAVRERKKRESARRTRRWKRGARWCGAGCLRRVDSLAFGVARREGHCQCQGGSRQPSRATANRATFFLYFSRFRCTSVPRSFPLERLVPRHFRFFLIVSYWTNAPIEDAFSRLFQRRTGTRSLWVASLWQHCVVVTVVVLRLRACVRENPDQEHGDRRISVKWRTIMGCSTIFLRAKRFRHSIGIPLSMEPTRYRSDYLVKVTRAGWNLNGTHISCNKLINSLYVTSC